MNVSSISTRLLFATLLSAPAALLAAPTAVGTAYSLDDGRIVYRELHYETYADDGRLVTCRVRYEDADGELIAEKQAHFDTGLSTPTFELTAAAGEFREGARVAPGEITLYNAKRARTLERPGAAVVDAGFHHLIRENLARLAGGERLEFPFAVPAAGRFLEFQLRTVGEVVYNNAPALRLQMRPANAMLRLALDPIELIYGRDGRLWLFEGISNIPDGEGSRYEVRIVFDYPSSAPSERVAAP